MKLLHLKVTNLNSLYGEHTVDLENGLANAPLFLIMGPTGAGKSTLLDAISLALFGETPRLPVAKTSTELELDSRNVMSRGTGEALAQVVFSKVEEGSSVRYRASWTCHRARRKASGAFQDPSRSLERAVGSGPFELLVDSSKEKVYREPFTRALEGMKVEDFKRSMLLAQGEFALFLKADEDQRAAILERLTHTAHYRELGALAAQRRREAEQELRAASAMLQGVALLSTDEQQALELAAQRARTALQEAKDLLRELDHFAGWKQQKENLTRAEHTAKEQQHQAQQAHAHERVMLDRLALHERSATAIPTLQQLDRLRGESSALETSLPALRARVETLSEQERGTSQEALAHTQALALASGRLREASPQLAEARRLHQALASARAEYNQATLHLEQTRQARERAETAREKGEAAALKAQLEEEHAAQAVAALESARPLIESLAGFEVRAAALEKSLQERGLREQRASDLERELARDTARAQELQGDKSVAQERHLQAQALHQAAQTTLLGCLAKAQGVRERRGQLNTQLDLLKRSLQHLNQETALRSSLRQTSEALAQARQRRALKAAELEEGTLRVQTVQQTLEDQRWMQRMARERSRLKAGSDCPLCGGTEHPHLNHPKIAEVDARVEARCQVLELDLSELGSAITTLRSELTSLEKAETTQETRHSGLEQSLRDLDAAWLQLSEGLPATFPWPQPAQQLEAQHVLAREQLQSLESAEADERQRANAAAEASTAHERLAAELELSLRQMEEKKARLRESRTASQEESAREAREREALLQELGPLTLVTAEGLPAALAQARHQVKSLREADSLLLLSHQKIQTTNEARAAAQATLLAADAACAHAAQALASRAEALRSLEPQAAASLEGRSPDAVERELTEAQASAASLAQQATTLVQQLRAELSKQVSHLEAQEKNASLLTQTLEQTSGALQAQLEALQLPSEAALRGSLLSPEEARALQSHREQLQRDLETTRRLAEERSRDVFTHETQKPPVQTGWALLSLAELAPHREGLEAQLEAALRDVLDFSGKLEAHEKAQQKHHALQQQREAARERSDTWERLHRLIGVGDGDAFKRYAQTLNLAELMARANQHLERLSPRYTLVGAKGADGAARLAFAIQDAFQAGEVRPIHTLSGGETFLVSLALALALAGYRQIKMPIETLLLDEGFGTLDPETLQVAMNALESLHASGTQVGIVSHVESLKERITSRIVVERDGAGRSSVRIELG